MGYDIRIGEEMEFHISYNDSAKLKKYLDINHLDNKTVKEAIVMIKNGMTKIKTDYRAGMDEYYIYITYYETLRNMRNVMIANVDDDFFNDNKLGILDMIVVVE